MPARADRLVFLLLLSSLGHLGCPRGEISGTYEAELLVERIGVPIEGTLVLGAPGFDLGVEAAPFVVSETADGDSADEGIPEANSCLIVPPVEDGPPRFVTLFAARINSQGVAVPFGLFETGRQRIDVTALDPLGNTLGGEVVFREAEDEKEYEGGLYADRTGPADGALCLDALETWKEALDAALSESETTPER